MAEGQPEQLEDFVWFTSILAQSAVDRLRSGKTVQSDPFGRPSFRWRLCFEPLYWDENSTTPAMYLAVLRRVDENGPKVPFWVAFFSSMRVLNHGTYDLEPRFPMKKYAKNRTKVVVANFAMPEGVCECLFRVMLHYVPQNSHVGVTSHNSVTLRNYWPWKYGMALAEQECGYSITVQDGTFLQGFSKPAQTRMMELTVLCNLRKEYVVPALVMADILGLPRLKEVAIMYGAFHGLRMALTTPRNSDLYFMLLITDIKTSGVWKNLARWRYPLLKLVLNCALKQNPKIAADEAWQKENGRDEETITSPPADVAPAMTLDAESRVNDNISHDLIVLPAISE